MIRIAKLAKLIGTILELGFSIKLSLEGFLKLRTILSQFLSSNLFNVCLSRTTLNCFQMRIILEDCQFSSGVCQDSLVLEIRVLQRRITKGTLRSVREAQGID